jgi:hypothetical protein
MGFRATQRNKSRGIAAKAFICGQIGCISVAEHHKEY